MADQLITNLVALSKAGVDASDVLPIVDISSGETKKVTAKDLVGAGIDLVDNNEIDISKINQASATKLGSAALEDGAVSYAKIQAVSATNKLLGRSSAGSGAVEEIDCTAAGRALLDDADATAQRATLGLGTLATQAASGVAITGGSISGITDLAVADGGTGASTAAAARTNLGVAIGTDVQAFDPGLSSIAGLTTSANQTVYTTGADTYATTPLTAAGRALLDDVTSADQRATLGLGNLATLNTVTATEIANDAVTAAKLANDSTCVTAASKAALDAITGDFVGQLGLTTDTQKIYVWQSNGWQLVKASSSINTITTTATGVLSSNSSANQDSITISTSLSNTNAAAQFLAGPSGAAGEVAYRTIAGSDLPDPTTTTKGGVVVNGGGLGLTGSTIRIDNAVTPVTDQLRKISYNAQGVVTASSSVSGGDLPVATSIVRGAVMPGTGLTVDNNGVLNHTNAVAATTQNGITYDAQGHITNVVALVANDIPDIPATKVTSGTLDVARIGTNTITGPKLANFAITKIGETQPTADQIGQFFFNPLTRDLFLWDGNVFQPIGISVGEIVFAGTFDASTGGGTGLVATVTAEGTAIGLAVGQPLPAAATANNRYYLVVSEPGTITSGNAPNVSLSPPDIVLSNGNQWTEIDVSQTFTTVTATQVSYTPSGNIAANNVQAAIDELDSEKLARAGGTVTGTVLLGTTGVLGFEGATDNAFEGYFAAADYTADRTWTLPDQSGNVIISGNASIVNADLSNSAAIAFSKLASLTSGNIILGNASNVPTATAVTGDITISNTGVTAITADSIVNADINSSAAIAFSKLASLASGNILVGNGSGVATSVAVSGDVTISNTGVTSIAAGAIVNADISASAAIDYSKLATLTSGNIVLGNASNVATSTAVTGDVTISNTGVTSIAAGAIVNADINASAAIADTKLATISTAGKVSNSATTATNLNTASAIVARDASGNFSAGTITAALSGNASTATTLQTARTIQGVSFDGSANITVVTQGTGISVSGTQVTNTGVTSLNGNTGAITNVAVTNTAQSFTAAQRGSITALTSAATVTPDFAVANNYSLTLGHNVTLANPTNLTAGQSGAIVITQGSGTAYTLSFGSNWKFSGGTPTMSTGLSSVSTLVYYVESATRITAQLLTNVA